MQVPGSRIPPVRAATVAGDLYKPCAYLHTETAVAVVEGYRNIPEKLSGLVHTAQGRLLSLEPRTTYDICFTASS